MRMSVRHACHILGTMHDRVLKCHISIRHQKLADACFFCFFFLSELSHFFQLLSPAKGGGI